MIGPGFDAALPTLPGALDPEAVRAELEPLWRASRPALARVTGCARSDTRYEPGERCLVAHALTGKDAGGGAAATFGVADVTPAGTAYRLFGADPRLPGLAEAIDAARMRERFRRLAGVPEGDLRARAVAYKPEQRCVIEYELGPGRVYGKVAPGDARRRAETLAALHAASAQSHDMPVVARSLAHWPDLALDLQAAVPHASDLTAASLHAGTPPATTAGLARRAGVALAALHADATAVAGPAWTATDDVGGLRAYRGLFAAAAPGLAEAFDEVAAALARRAVAAEPDPVPSHGALRTDQFLVGADGRLALVDFDGFCWANPARDVANLLAYLRWRTIRRPEEVSTVTAAAAAFAEGYASRRAPPEAAWRAVYEALSLVRLAGRRLRRLETDDWHRLPRVLEAARDLAG